MAIYNSNNNELDLQIRSTWGAGLVADLSLTPSEDLDGWTVAFDYSGDIVNIWNARIVSRDGDRYVVESVGYNDSVPAGGTVSFGFQGSGSNHDITPVALAGEPVGAPSDPVPLPTVSVADAVAAEDDGSINFNLTLSEPSATDVVVAYRTVAGTAVDGVDFAPANTEITIPAGQTSATVSVALTDDAVAEGSEDFALELLSATGATIGDGTATGTITDADVPPADAIVVTVTGGSVTEADPTMMHMHDDGSMHMHDDGHRTITFTVSLDQPAAEALTLGYSTADGTAVADTTSDVAWDYHTATGTLVFAPGEQTKQIPVSVHPDTLVEDTETFTLTVTGDNITGTLTATGTIYDNDAPDPGDGGSDDGGGGTTYRVGETAVITGFDPLVDTLDLGPDSIHNQIPVDTPDGFMMLHMFNGSRSTLVEGVSLAEFQADTFAPIADAHLQQDLSAALAWENGKGLVRDNTVYIRSHEQDLAETVDFDPATDKISFFYLSVRGDGLLNFAVEETDAGVRFYSPLTGQSMTLLGVTFDDLTPDHFEWRANQLEDNIAGRMGLADVIDGFEYVSENVFSGKSVEMAGGVDRAPYHSVQGYEEYTGTPIGQAGGGDAGGGSGDDPGDTDGGSGDDPITVMVTGGAVTEADPGMMHMHDDGSMHMHDDGHRYITFTVSLAEPAAEELTLGYATADGTAVADTTSDVAWDYHAAAGSLVFAPGEQTQNVIVAVHPDTLVEDTETFTLTVTGDNITGTLSATGTVYDNDSDDTGAGGGTGGGTGGSGPFVGGGTTYAVGQTTVVSDFDPTRDVLDLGPNSIHNQFPVDTPDGFMMLNMFNSGQSLLLEGVFLKDLQPENFAPISDAHLQQDLSAVLAYENGTGLVRPNTVYIRSHQEGLVETVDFNPATDKISFFYLSVRGDGLRNFAVEDTPEGARFFNPITGQSLTLNGVSFSELTSEHFEWRANQLEDNIAGRMGLSDLIDGFQYVPENVFSGKSVEMAGGVDRAPYHSVQGYEEYTGTPIGQSDSGDAGGGSGGTGDDPADDPIDDPTDDPIDDPVDHPVDPAPAGGDVLNGPLSTRGTEIIDADGNKVDIKGVNWFGFETTLGVLHGLWARNMEDMLDEIAGFGFNMIRLPFAGELALNDRMPGSINTGENPDLAGLTSHEVLERFLDAAAERGIAVLLDMHRTTPGDGPEAGGRIPNEQDFLDQWAAMADKFGDHPAVIGFDLYNEPHGYSWDEWAPIAESAGNMLLQSHPDELIIVEGVETYEGDSHWWGGNLQGVADRPVVLSADDKLVYSPHEYATSVFGQPYFFEVGFDPETDLPEIFRENWGFIEEQGIAPVLVGEFGSTFDSAIDQAWGPALADYLTENDIDWAFWAWNPNSGDTGGVVEGDWQTPRQAAFEYLLDTLLGEGSDGSGTPIDDPVDDPSDDPGDDPSDDPGDGTLPSDPAVLSVSGQSILEGDGGSTSVTFTLTLSEPKSGPVTVDFTTADGTAVAGSDYVARSGQVTFAAGETSKTVVVDVIGDSDLEPDEDFSLLLSNVTGDAALSVAEASATITNDDTAPDPGDGDVGDNSASVSFVVRESWNGGFVADLTITNTGDEPLSDWEVSFLGDFTIGDIWGAEVVERTGDVYTLAGAGWGSTLGAGQSMTFGFVGRGGSGPGSLDGLTLNGASQSDDPPVNEAPTAQADVAQTEAETAVFIDVLANDSDPEGDALTIEIVDAPAGGEAIVTQGGIRYTPDAGTSGFQTFTYRVLDGENASLPADVTVDVAAPAPESDPAPEPDPSPSILDLYLAYTDTDTIAVGLTDDAVLDFALFEDRPLTVYAEAAHGAPAIGSVQLTLDGIGTRMENVTPYALFGDSGGDFAGGANLTPGTYSLTVTAFSGQGGNGDVLGSEELSFTIEVPQAADDPDTPDGPDTPPPPSTDDDVEATLYHFDEIKSGNYTASSNPEFAEVTPDTHLVQSNDFGQPGYNGHNWGGVNPNMYRGFDYAGRDRDIGEPVGSGPTIQVNAGMTTQEIEDTINNAPDGATVEFQAGTYWLTETINVNRGDLHIKGVSEDSVIIRADNVTQDAAFRVSDGIRGKLGPEEAKLVTDTTGPVGADDKVVELDSVAGIEPGDFIEFTYNYDADLNTRVNTGDGFNKLSSLVEVAAVDTATNTVTLREKVGMDYDPDRSVGNAEVRVYDKDDFIHNLVISDLTIQYMDDDEFLDIVDPHDLFNYNNENYGGDFAHKIAGIRLEGVHESDVINVTVKNAASIGIWIDAGYQVGVQNFAFDGAQNLGGGGNGYGILLDDSFYGDFEGLEIGSTDADGNIFPTRHAVVFGYSSSGAYNNIQIDYTNSNIDFHGGADYGNLYYVIEMNMTRTDHYNFGVMDDRFVLDGIRYNKIQNTYIFDEVTAHEEGQIPDYVGSLVPGQEDGQGHWANNGSASSYVDVVYMSANGGTVRTFGKDDVIHSGVGVDEMWGGGGSDAFVIYDNSNNDTIYDFSTGDRIVIKTDVNGSGIETAADALARVTQMGDDAVLDLGGGNTLTLAGFQSSSLNEQDFEFF